MADVAKLSPDPSGSMPHGASFGSDASLIRLHLVADLAVGAACCAIATIVMLRVLRARRAHPSPRPPMPWAFVTFGAFMAALGATHFLQALDLYRPVHWLTGEVKMLTALASFAAAVALPPFVPWAAERLNGTVGERSNGTAAQRSNGTHASGAGGDDASASPLAQATAAPLTHERTLSAVERARNPGARASTPAPRGRIGPTAALDAGDLRPSVLVIDDDPETLAHVSGMLGRDHRVRSFGRADEALEAARQDPPDIVVGDVLMRSANGDELLDRMRADEALHEIPVLLLTTRVDPEFRADVLRRGASDYALKPVTDTELLARVRNMTDLKHSRDTLERELATRSQTFSTLALEATFRKRELERTLQEKQTLLQEVHHRVKGNLQTITSLLKLRARRVEDPTARRVLDESVDRVRVMALLHETLYRSGNPSRVELPEYLRSVLSNLFRSQDADLGRLEIVTPPDAPSVDLEMAVPLGLLVHELVSNALRHAFPEGRVGGIRVALARAPDGAMVLEVSDEGVGLPIGMEMGTSSSLGLQLAHSLAEQLGGALEIERNGGTRFRLRFQDTQEVSA